MIKDHLFPRTVEETISLLEKYAGKARLIAGGTDLIIEMREGKYDFEVLVDIEKLDQLGVIREEGEAIFVGSGVTFAELEESELINKNAVAISQAASLVGGPQIRNRGTIGGNIVSAQPAADGVLALFAFETTLEITGTEGTRKIPIKEAFQGIGKSRIDPTRELLVGVQFAKRKSGEGSNYQRIAIRRALQLPILACAIFVKTRNESIEESRTAIGPVAEVPFRVMRAEEYLKGKSLTEGVLQKTGEIVSEEVNPRHSKLRGGGFYRKQLAAVIVRRGLLEAAAIARRSEACRRVS